MAPDKHKQYLIDSIAEMNVFIDKAILSIHDRRDTITEGSLNAMYSIIDRKKSAIKKFKSLLLSEYSHIID